MDKIQRARYEMKWLFFYDEISAEYYCYVICIRIYLDIHFDVTQIIRVQTFQIASLISLMIAM